MVTCDEIRADEATLLCNDGHVLEIFGFVDARRYHLAMDRPQVEIVQRRRSTRVVVDGTRHRSELDCDPARVDDVRAFAARLAAAVAVAVAVTRTPGP